MSPAETDELRALRARAYGPAADIAGDPVAAARLAELEQMLRAPVAEPAAGRPAAAAGREPSPAVVPAIPPASERPEPVQITTVQSAAETPASADETSAPGRVRWWRSAWVQRRLVPLWIGSLAVVAVVAATVTGVVGALSQVARSPDVRQVATLTENADTQWPQFLGSPPPEGAVGYLDFHGLTAFLARSEIWPGAGDADCLTVIATDQVDGDGMSFAGPYYGGCGAGAFPAELEFVVTADLPEAFRARFPEGTSVQFVYDGRNVGVFVATG